MPTLPSKWVIRKTKMTVKNKYQISAKNLEDRVLYNTSQTAIYTYIFKCKIRFLELCKCYSSKGQHKG